MNAHFQNWNGKMVVIQLLFSSALIVGIRLQVYAGNVNSVDRARKNKRRPTKRTVLEVSVIRDDSLPRWRQWGRQRPFFFFHSLFVSCLSWLRPRQNGVDDAHPNDANAFDGVFLNWNHFDSGHIFYVFQTEIYSNPKNWNSFKFKFNQVYLLLDITMT